MRTSRGHCYTVFRTPVQQARQPRGITVLRGNVGRAAVLERAPSAVGIGPLRSIVSSKSLSGISAVFKYCEDLALVIPSSTRVGFLNSWHRDCYEPADVAPVPLQLAEQLGGTPLAAARARVSFSESTSWHSPT